jgi:hypothetical protein
MAKQIQPFVQAIQKRDFKSFKSLLSSFKGILSRNRQTILLHIVIENQYDMLKMIITYSKTNKIDINLNMKSCTQCTCGCVIEFVFLLQKAIELNHFNILKLLIEEGANINQVDDNGVSILTMAVFYDRFEMVKFLIAKGANINSRDKNGDTPIMYACNHVIEMNNRYSIVRWLVDCGVLLGYKSKNGDTAQILAELAFEHNDSIENLKVTTYIGEKIKCREKRGIQI